MKTSRLLPVVCPQYVGWRAVPGIAMLAALTLALLFPAGLWAQVSAARPRVLQRVDPNSRVSLAGSASALALPKFDAGVVDDATPAAHMLLVLKRSDAQEASLLKLIDEMHTPSSPNFHKWQTPEQFAARFSPADADVSAVRTWLETEGFQVNKLSKGGLVLDFSGTAGQIKSAFHTEMHAYTRDGMTFHANSTGVEIPAALAPVIQGFATLSDHKPSMHANILGTSPMNMKTHTATPDWNYEASCYDANGNIVPCTRYVPGPGDFGVQYNISPVYKAGLTGKGEIIGVISDSNINASVVQRYRTINGFDPSNLPIAVVDGEDSGQINGSASEAYLDVEAAYALAPDATVNVYVSNGSLVTSGLQNAALRAVDDNVADILTLSYGECERNLGPAGNQFFYSLWEQAAAQGQSVFGSSGDGGSAGCDDFNSVGDASLGLAVNGFSSTPFNTSVGGTDFFYPHHAERVGGVDLTAELNAAWGVPTTFNPATSLLAPITEQVWNEAQNTNIAKPRESIVGGSGGASNCIQGTGVDPITGVTGTCTAGYPKPSWQAGVGVPSDNARDVPDVALFAAGGENLSFWAICAGLYDCVAAYAYPNESINITGVSGTSASTPAAAGIMALIDQSQKGRQGNANPTFYALAAQFPNSFNDVTIGSDSVRCIKGTPNCILDPAGSGNYFLSGFAAGVGYDQASGLGTFNVANVIANWSKVLAPGTSTTTLSLSQTSFAHGTPVMATATVASTTATATGAVALETTSTLPGQTGIGVIELTKGTGTESISSLPGGTYSLTGVYSGDGIVAKSSSTPVMVTVTPETSALILSALSYNDIYNLQYPVSGGATLPYGYTMFLDATVAGSSGSTGAGTGLVTYFDNGTPIGTASIGSGGAAELATGLLTPGVHKVTASYAGDASYSKSSAAPLMFTLAKSTPYVYNTGGPYIVTYPNQAAQVETNCYGGVNAAPCTGTMTVTFGSLPPQTVTLVSAFRAVPIGLMEAFFTPTAVGSYVVQVTYNGDSNYLPKAAAPYTLVVTAPTKASTSASISADKMSSMTGGVIQLTGKVTGSIAGTIPTGTFRFYYNGLGVYGPLDATGTFSVVVGAGSFATGSNVVYGQYNGDKNYSNARSAPITIMYNGGDYSLSTSTPDLAVTSGMTATGNLTIASIVDEGSYGGLTGNVNFTCTPSSPAISCTMNPSAVALGQFNQQVNSTITISTHMAPTASTEGGRLLLWSEGGGLAMAGLLLLLPRTRQRYGKLLMLLLLVGAGWGITGCGQKSPVAPVPAPTPTPTGNAAPGKYTVLINAVSSGIQHQIAINVIVQ